MELAEGPAASVEIVKAVKGLGLKPFTQAEPLPPIEEDEVLLVCWMAVNAA